MIYDTNPLSTPPLKTIFGRSKGDDAGGENEGRIRFVLLLIIGKSSRNLLEAVQHFKGKSMEQKKKNSSYLRK